MSRVFLRRERILPGPLKTLQQPAGRKPLPITSLALASAAIAAGLLLMPQLTPRVTVDPTPMAEFAGASDAEPAAAVYAASDSMAPAAEPPARSEAAGSRASTAEIAPAVASPAAASAPVQAAASAPATPAVEASLFQLEHLPVLQDDVSELDPAALPAAAPQRAQAKSPSRRAMAAKGATSTQP